MVQPLGISKGGFQRISTPKQHEMDLFDSDHPTKMTNMPSSSPFLCWPSSNQYLTLKREPQCLFDVMTYLWEVETCRNQIFRYYIAYQSKDFRWILSTSHDLTPQGSLVPESSLFCQSPDGWKISLNIQYVKYIFIYTAQCCKKKYIYIHV